MLNVERVTRWIHALRSGEYKQAREYLRSGDRFCCLGVACDIYAKDTGDGKWSDGGLFKAHNGEQRSFQLIPPSVKDYFGLNYHPGDDTDLAPTLMLMNDVKNKTFGEIADYLEKQASKVKTIIPSPT